MLGIKPVTIGNDRPISSSPHGPRPCSSPLRELMSTCHDQWTNQEGRRILVVRFRQFFRLNCLVPSLIVGRVPTVKPE